MKIAIMTLGCRTNQAESERLNSHIILSGHERIVSMEEADLTIINSCTVTAKADRQSRNLINRARRSGARVIVTGCFAGRNKDSIRDTNITVIDNLSKDSIISMIPQINSSGTIDIKYSRNRPIIKVQDGCNNYCSYCIVPAVRGNSRSMPLDAILEEVRQIVSLGYKEVVLSGIHLGQYGAEQVSGSGLSVLLEEILDKTNIGRIRLSSIEVHEISNAIVDMIVANKVCSHLHIPLQGGTNRLLSLMNRNYSLEEFRDRIIAIRSKVPSIAIGSDIMVGFPGESEEEFNCSYNAIKSIPFSYLHVFPFSKRPGTAAFEFPEQVEYMEKKKRAVKMTALGKSMYSDFIQKNIGTTQDLIVESVEDEFISGTTSNYIKVRVPDKNSIRPGSLIKIRVTRGTTGLIEGVPHNES